MKNKTVFFSLAAALILGGCATNPMTGTGTPQASASAYSAASANVIQGVLTGTVIAVHRITIAGTPTGAGLIGGALVGGVLGHQIGGGLGQSLATGAGAIAGALGGQALEGAASKENGLLVTVRLDNGNTVAIAQAADVPLTVGERVELIGGTTASTWGQPARARVLPLN